MSQPGGKVEQWVRGVLSPNISSWTCGCHSRYTLVILYAFCGWLIIWKMSMFYWSAHCESFIVMGGLVFDGKKSEWIKSKFSCILGSFSSPRLLVSNWWTSEKTTNILTFPFSLKGESLSQSTEGPIVHCGSFASRILIIGAHYKDGRVNLQWKVRSGEIR